MERSLHSWLKYINIIAAIPSFENRQTPFLGFAGVLICMGKYVMVEEYRVYKWVAGGDMNRHVLHMGVRCSGCELGLDSDCGDYCLIYCNYLHAWCTHQ